MGILGALAALLLVACDGGAAASDAGLPVATIRVGNQQVVVEVAFTAETRRRGLMFRDSLPPDQGMLFVFPREEKRAFWMRNTSISLSIAVADAAGRIVRIADLEPHVERAVPSLRPARYALEMNRGWFRRHGVLEGDTLRRLPPAPAE